MTRLRVKESFNLTRLRVCFEVLHAGVCSRVAAISYVDGHLKAMHKMQTRLKKTPIGDRDRRAGFELKVKEQVAAHASAVKCVREVMGFDPNSLA